jgi:hypothetical protein
MGQLGRAMAAEEAELQRAEASPAPTPAPPATPAPAPAPAPEEAGAASDADGGAGVPGAAHRLHEQGQTQLQVSHSSAPCLVCLCLLCRRAIHMRRRDSPCVHMASNKMPRSTDENAPLN